MSGSFVYGQKPMKIQKQQNLYNNLLEYFNNITIFAIGNNM